MDEQNRKSNTHAYIGAGIIILAIIIAGAYSYNHKNKEAAENTEQTDKTDSTVVTDATSTPGTTPGGAKLSYGEAIKAYPYRLQFVGKCQGDPDTLAVKKGSTVMLDNRNPGPITIVADKQTFKIAGYDYALLHTSALGNLVVTCDGKNSVTLNVQK